MFSALNRKIKPALSVIACTVLFSLGFAIPLASAESILKGSSFGFRQTSEFVSEAACYESLRVMKGCLSFVAYIASRLPQKSLNKPLSNAEFEKQLKNTVNAEATQLFNHGNIKTIFNEALPRMIEQIQESAPQEEATIALGALNYFFAYASDTHTTLVPYDYSEAIETTQAVFLSFKDDVATIQIKRFSRDPQCGEMKRALNNVIARKANKLILDLRNNSGGSVSNAICIGSLFIGEKVIARTVNLENGKIRQGHARKLTGREPKATDIPIVVLINDKTKSSAELLASALRDHSRAWLVGDRSFGKGTVQAEFPFFDEVTANGTRKVTIYKYVTQKLLLSPLGWSHQKVGITPDFTSNESKPTVNNREEDQIGTVIEGVNADVSKYTATSANRIRERTEIQTCLNSSSAKMAAKMAAKINTDNELALSILDCSR